MTDTLTIDQAAELLHMHPVTLSEKAASGEIPAAKVGKRWLFVRVDLIDWIRAKYSAPCQSTNNPRPTAGMSIYQYRDTRGLDDLLAPRTSSRRKSITTA